MLPLSKSAHWLCSAKPLQKSSAKIRQNPLSTSYAIHALLADAKAIIDQFQRDVIAGKRRCRSTPLSHINCLGKHRY
ncbi:hypothetical protein [Erwinia billingiae]|uniref:hypothetical protein n=1 Tax=Erwinia billingiae TaxID=182337 RepID=UPI002248085C|nr:hypothetical protein [Erwinia billingiae]